MGKQNKKKKMRLPDLFTEIRQSLFKKAAVAVVAIIFIMAATLLVKAFLYKSDYFKLKVVETRAVFLDRNAASIISGQVLDMYKTQNIFKIPLKFIARSIQTSYADVKDVVVRIALPDKLIIDIKLRRPIALVHNVKYYPIDEEGFVLPAVAASGVVTDLPIIEGVDLRYGMKSSPRNLSLAMGLLREIRQTKSMASYGVTLINASDGRNISFYLKNGLEVRMGSEDFKDRLEVLLKTLKDPRLIIDRIKYIDVRFDDVAIGPK